MTLPGLLLTRLGVGRALQGGAVLQGALQGLKVAAVGLLLAALLHPVGTHGLRSLADATLAAAACRALVRLRWPPWLAVPVCAALGGTAFLCIKNALSDSAQEFYSY